MKTTKTIKNVFDESGLSENDYTSYSGFLQSKLLETGSETNAPWFIKIITIIGAWLGSLLLLGSLVLANIVQSEESMITFGTIFTITGIILSYTNKKTHHLDSISLSLSIIGQILLGIGIGTKSGGLKPVCYAGIIVQSIIYLVAQSYTQKFLSVILIPACLLGIIWNSAFSEATHFLIGALSITSVLIWTGEIPLQIRLKKHPYFYVTTAYGLVLGLLLILLISINNKFFWVNISHWYITSLISFFSLTFLLYKSLCQNLGLRRTTFWLTVIVIAVILSPTAQTPGVITSLMVIVLGFAKSNRVLLTLGILFLAIYLISFYYSLQQTLLIKSIILMSTGALLIGIYSVLAMIKKKVAIT